MRGRTTLVLLGVFAALAFYVIRFERGKESEGERDVRARQILALGEENFTERIQIFTETDSLELRRTDLGAWRLVYPVDDRADNNAVVSLLQQLNPLEVTHRVNGSRRNQIAYRLDRPSVLASFLQPKSSGYDVRTLAVGRKNVQLDGYYVQADKDTAKVGIVPSWFVESFLTREPMHYRYRRLTEIRPEQANRLGVSTGAGKVLLARDEKRRWRVTHPVQTPADQPAVNELIRRYVTQRISSFVNEAPSDLAAYGLDDPVVTLQIVLENNTTTVFHIGGPADEALEEVYAKLEGRENVITIPGSSQPEFAKTLHDLRDRRIFPFEPRVIHGLTVESPAGAFAAARDSVSGEWVLVDEGGAPTPLDQTPMTQAVQNLSVLEGREFFEGMQAAAGKGFQTPAATVTVRLVDGRERTVQFSLHDDGAFARVYPQGIVARVREVDSALVRGFVVTPPVDRRRAGSRRGDG